jgi:two-component sensor histidine kinase
MLYGADSFAGVYADEFLATITSAVLNASGLQARVITQADQVQLANDLAIPVSLILNELIANALKYGRSSEADLVIRVNLNFVGGEYLVSVEDSGPGFDLLETRKRASGLGLVRGLVRQLGGSLSVERGPGARVLVRFKDRSLSNIDKAAS